MSELMPYILGLAGVVLTALVTFYGQKLLSRTNRVTEKLTERRDTIADRDSALNGFRNDVLELRKEIKELRDEVEKVRDHNNALIAFIYKMISLLRRHELLDQIEPGSVPPGVHL